MNNKSENALSRVSHSAQHGFCGLCFLGPSGHLPFFPQLCSARPTASTPTACPPALLPARTQKASAGAQATMPMPLAEKAASATLALPLTRASVYPQLFVAAEMPTGPSSR